MPQSKEVEFRSEGYRLIGNLHIPRENAPCVVLCHGIASSKDSEKWVTFANRLENEGYAVLRYNFRGCGWGDKWSEGDSQDTTLTNRIKDYRAALDYLEGIGEVDTNRLGVVGSSFGGRTMIAANDPRPRVYIALATSLEHEATPEMQRSFKEKGYYEFPGTAEPRMVRISQTLFEDLKMYNLKETVRRIRHPILIIHGSEDVIPISDVLPFYACANEPKKLEIIEGGSHLFTDTGHLGRVIDMSVVWLNEYL